VITFAMLAIILIDYIYHVTGKHRVASRDIT